MKLSTHIIRRLSQRCSWVETNTILERLASVNDGGVSIAAYLYKDADAQHKDRTTSNGDCFVAVFREGKCVTGFWRRSTQPDTPESMQVERVIKLI